MSVVDLGAVIVALIAALGAWASQRAASRATTINTSISGRMDAEKEAYERARSLDIQTINRQKEEISALRQVIELLRIERDALRKRIRRLENFFPEWERLLNERLDEEDGDDHE